MVPGSDGSTASDDRARRPGRAATALVWAALALAPVLFLVETTGPRWLNLFLRGVWVAVVVAVAVLLGLQRTSGHLLRRR